MKNQLFRHKELGLNPRPYKFLEKFIWAWIKSEFLMPKKLVFHSTNTYYELMKPTIEQKQKEAYKNND